MHEPKNKLFALVDCNNFYASCERVFNPKLEGKPVVVLSNNDGCVIARSNEAKTIGVQMGHPAFQMADIIEKNNVFVFSTNFVLYGDMSDRVMNTLAQYTPDIEIYSIDEAFLDFTGFETKHITEYAREIRNTVKQWTGIPVSIGIAETKTLAKAANHLAKKNPEFDGVLSLYHNDQLDSLLGCLPVDDVWGVGRQFSKFLMSKGIYTALDLKNADEKWILKHMHVPGQRTVMELRGTSCIRIESIIPDRKGICTARSFGKPLGNYEDIEQAVANFAAKCSEKLRRQNSITRNLTVFIMTNRFADTPQYVNGKTILLPVATNHANEIIHHALIGLRLLFRQGYQYKKAGVILSDFVPENQQQFALWDNIDRGRFAILMKSLDSINTSNGDDVVKFAIQGTRKRWKMKQERLSPCYTTRWKDLLTIDMNKKIK